MVITSGFHQFQDSKKSNDHLDLTGLSFQNAHGKKIMMCSGI